jgi:hypothetical protein
MQGARGGLNVYKFFDTIDIMDNNLSLGRIVSGNSVYEIQVGLFDTSGTSNALPNISKKTLENARQVAQQILTQYGQKFEAVYGAPDYFGNDGFQVQSQTISHNLAGTQKSWDLFKRTLLNAAPELKTTLEKKEFGVRVQPRSPEKYLPCLEAICYKLEHKQPLSQEEHQELDWFASKSGSKDPAVIRSNIAHYFLGEEPSLTTILQKLEGGDGLEELEEKKYTAFQAWHRAWKQQSPDDQDHSAWLAALKRAIAVLQPYLVH